MPNINKINIDNKIIRYSKFGNGQKDFVIVPGLDINYVTDVTDLVEKMYKAYLNEYTFYIFDRPDNPSSNYSLVDMADDLYLAIKEVGLSNIVLTGASQGGCIALVLASKHPELVSKLVLSSTTAKSNEQSDKILSNWYNLGLENRQIELNGQMIDDVYSSKMISLYKDEVMKSTPIFDDNMMNRFVILNKSLLGFDLREYAENIKCPTIVFHAIKDKIFDIECAKELVSLTNANYHFFAEEYSHNVYDEASDYLPRLFEFLDK